MKVPVEGLSEVPVESAGVMAAIPEVPDTGANDVAAGKLTPLRGELI